jgi:hypothetical protein
MSHRKFFSEARGKNGGKEIVGNFSSNITKKKH